MDLWVWIGQFSSDYYHVADSSEHNNERLHSIKGKYKLAIWATISFTLLQEVIYDDIKQ